MKNNEVAHNIMRRLLIAGQSRGRSASGVAYVSSKEVAVVKKNVSSSALVNLPEYNEAEEQYFNLVKPKYEIVAVHGHCRLPTKGSPEDNNNNHPIASGQTVGAHNGMIANDDALFTIHDMSRKGEVDSEAIFALVDRFAESGKETGDITNAIVSASSVLSGSYACSLTHLAQPHCLFLFRNYSPCDVLHFPEKGLIIWASSIAFIRTAIEHYDLGRYEEIEIPRNSGIGVDLANSKINRFNLRQLDAKFA